ncbi:DUF3035 domain-containing protein [Oceanicaulis alexandrii]|uniref:DUF3035 domain-containing protein n=2 Tax=Oceanicaulis alexandrii TaxID=153233 RepID=UPI0004270B73|nr:DUF3035 domain-containing protein [Oceanicaulis alexandrii]
MKASFRPMRMRTALILSATALFALTGCNSGVRQALGVDKTTPDEFRVVTIAPLSVPPEYNLTPPRPGELRAEDMFQDQQARRALFGDLSGTNASDAEILFASRAGAADANPNVRAIIDGETASLIRKDQSFADRVLFWRDNERLVQQGGEPIDPDDATAAIEGVTGGGEVEIERRRTVRRKLPGL